MAGARPSDAVFLLGHLGLTLLVARVWAPLASAGERFPVGWLLLGALLPDLIDKPLGHGLLGWDNGRLWAHTLLFALVLVSIALARGAQRWDALALGTVCHQLFDRVWQDPASWLWPTAGAFPRGVSPGVPDWIAALLGDPFVWTTEALGLIALLALLVAPVLGWAGRWWEPSGSGAVVASLGLGTGASGDEEPDPDT